MKLRTSQAAALIGGLWSIHHSFSLDENTSATTSLEDESVKPRKILVGVTRLRVSISVTVIQGADEINS